MSIFLTFIQSTIGKKQIVATTGLMLILFLVGHLAGNLLIYLGPEAFNAYAKKLTSLRPGLYVIEFSLAGVFLIHIFFTACIVLENIKARGTNYSVYKPVGKRSLATRLMPYTGTIILIFLIKHLLDFTISDHHGVLNVMPDGRELGLYAVVYNSFLNPLNSCFYIVAMMCVGFHLMHGVQSFIQTFGFDRLSHSKLIMNISGLFGYFIAVAFSSIPVFILIDSTKFFK